ncbi:DMT family transporter [Streptomyces sp. TRM72054]|uniref:DMT family transporter n=1 Tax=Streptomyces sp. TRM72054 TaxID=2870562 RepID=UPI001C8B1102|nr:DMT family transporter [Streptomyces sp. TRM72054]MBX9393430.1 DMT family transporter [Streptomyces sp. TRM72054]
MNRYVKDQPKVAAESQTRNASRRPEALVAVSAATILLGSGPVAVGLTTLPTEQVVVLRLVMALPIVAVTALAVRRWLSARVFLLALPGALLFSLHIFLFFSAVRTTSVADVTFIQALQPLIVIAVAPRLFGERSGLRGMLLALGGIVGVLLVVLGSAENGSMHPGGELLAVANLFAWTAYFLTSKRIRARVGAVEYQASVNIVGGVLALPVAIFIGLDPRVVSASNWLLLLYVTVAAGIVGHALLNWAHPHVEALTSSMLVLMAPVVASIGAAIFLHQPITIAAACGGALVLACASRAVALSLNNSKNEGTT